MLANAGYPCRLPLGIIISSSLTGLGLSLIYPLLFVAATPDFSAFPFVQGFIHTLFSRCSLHLVRALPQSFFSSLPCVTLFQRIEFASHSFEPQRLCFASNRKYQINSIHRGSTCRTLKAPKSNNSIIVLDTVPVFDQETRKNYRTPGCIRLQLLLRQHLLSSLKPGQSTAMAHTLCPSQPGLAQPAPLQPAPVSRAPAPQVPSTLAAVQAEDSHQVSSLFRPALV